MKNVDFFISRLFFMIDFYILKKNFNNSFFRIGEKWCQNKDKAKQWKQTKSTFFINKINQSLRIPQKK